MSKKSIVLCFMIAAAWLAIFAPQVAADPPDPPLPGAAVAPSGPALAVEQAPVGPQDPSKFIPVAGSPENGSVGPAELVDMRRIAVTPDLLKSDGSVRAHIQGQFEQFGPVTEGKWARSPLAHSEHDTPMAEIEHPETKAVGPDATKAAGDYVVGFDARGWTGWIPPDTQMAAGPEYLVEALNSGFMVYSKTGTLTRAYTNFETFVNLPAPWSGFCFDPKVVFNRETNQFVMTIMGKDSTNLKSYVWILISRDANPNGSWWMYRIDTSYGTSGNEQWLDYASLGVDHWGIYFVGNSFGFPGVSAFQSRLWSFTPALLTGAGGSFQWWNDLRWPNNNQAFALQVAHPHSQNSGGNTFLVNNYPGSGSQVCLWQLNGDRYGGQGIGTPSLTRAAINSKTYYAIGNNVDQAGSGWDIDGGDCRVQNAVYSQGKLYGTFTLDWNNSKSYSEIYIFALNTGDSTMAWDWAHWNPDYFMFYPAITVEGGSSSTPNWFLAFSGTQPGSGTDSGYAGAMGFNRDQVDDTSRWFWETRGGGPYSRWDGDFVGDGRNRWGDYSMATYDWTCNNVWGATEFATSSNTWATRIVGHTIDDEDKCTYIRVRDPNNGGSFTAGNSYIITWDRLNLPAGDQLYVVFNDGSINHFYGPMSTSTTSYSWSVPNIPTPDGQIFVGSWDSGGGAYTVSDWSDSKFTVVGLPDLVKSVFTPPASAVQGESFSQYHSVRNQGTVTAGSFTVELRISTNDFCSSSDTLLSTRTVSSLGVGAFNGTTPTITIPAGQGVGTNYMCMMIDRLGSVAEFDETNNVTYTAINIIPSLIFEDGFESGNTSAWSSTVP